MRKIIYLPSFKRENKKLSNIQKTNTKKCIKQFKTGLYDKQLKAHKLKGNLRNEYAFSVEKDLRIVYTIKNGEFKLYLLEHIGTHNQVYR